VDRSKQAAPKVDEKSYEGADGEYAGSIGGEFGTITVSGGSYKTSDPDEQFFIESTLGWEGKVTKSGSAKSGTSEKE
jgi:hypothetical protein